jgi:predicted phage terminase large subunit-like protein
MDIEEFSGILAVDDPLKPDDARSKKKRDKVNLNYNQTLRSRLALDRDDGTPVVIIMQRIHEEDLSGFLLGGGSGEVWDHLMLPAIIDNGKKYPSKYTHGNPIAHGLPDGPLWDFKFSAERLAVFERSDRLTHAAQYMQDPLPMGDRIFEPEWWRYFDPERPPRFEWTAIYADTAQKTKEWNDYSVFQLWGAFEGNAYLLDQIRGKWKAPVLKRRALAFIDKHHQPWKEAKRVRYVKIEDKSSGTGLIQEINSISPAPVLPIPRSIDKVQRANDAAPSVEVGRVYLPKGASWLPTYEEEFERFSADMSHTYDDQVDPTLDAISDICGNRGGGFGTI